MAVFSVDTIPSDMALNHGITELERKINISNNAYFWSQKIKDYWNSIDTLDAPVWMNDRTTAMFNDDANYPYLVAENNVEADPGFNADVMTMVDSALAFIREIREGGSASQRFYNPSGGPLFPGRWPIPENLAYSNSELLTASTEGLPLGDLNWFPDKKAEWEILQTGIKMKENDAIVKDFSLAQNYPNPFNPTTSIKFTLKKSGYIKLAIYDMLGREVKTLLKGKKNAGEYSVSWNGVTNDGLKVPSGMYYYRLESNSYKQTKKMLLLR